MIITLYGMNVQMISDNKNETFFIVKQYGKFGKYIYFTYFKHMHKIITQSLISYTV